MTTQIQKDILARILKNNDKAELKVINVNATLNNSEPKIVQKMCEVLGVKEQSKSFHTVEMIESLQTFFDNNKNCSVLFIFEDIDYYIATTKQVLLYKILDML